MRTCYLLLQFDYFPAPLCHVKFRHINLKSAAKLKLQMALKLWAKQIQLYDRNNIIYELK